MGYPHSIAVAIDTLLATSAELHPLINMSQTSRIGYPEYAELATLREHVHVPSLLPLAEIGSWINQRQLTLLGVANDIGENVGLLPGLACNKFPPWAILLVGSLASFLGYGLIWLALSQTLKSLPYLLLWSALVIAANSSAWLTTSVLVTNMRNFPVSRGKVSGILKGYGGLSAAVFY
nr:protein NUCLEAR FUSION DEFECTIVE 4-like [Arachis hypogaea]